MINKKKTKKEAGRRSRASARGEQTLDELSELARRILAQWVSAETSTETPLERIEAEVEGVSRYEIVSALKELERAGAGSFSVGRKGKKSHFVWADHRSLLARQSSAPEALIRSDVVNVVKLPRSAPARGELAIESDTPLMLEHSFHIRSGVVAKVILPEDVTAAEVERLCRLLQVLPF